MDVRLRKPCIEDLDWTLAWHNDENISEQMLSFPPPIPRENEEKWMEKIFADDSAGRKIFRIIEAEGKPIGFVQLLQIEGVTGERALAIVVGDSKWRGQGAGARAMHLIMDWARMNLGLTSISLEVRTDNVKAIQFYERLGFKRVGTIIKTRRDKPIEMIQMRIAL